MSYGARVTPSTSRYTGSNYQNSSFLRNNAVIDRNMQTASDLCNNVTSVTNTRALLPVTSNVRPVSTTISSNTQINASYSIGMSNTQIANFNKTEVSPKLSNSNISRDVGPKPLNIFYVWYNELCRRQNTHPLPAITHGATWNNNQILDFTADRIKLEDWHPIINALRLDMSLHVICIHSRLTGQKLLEYADTEERVKKIKKWFGTICTKFILKNFVKAVSSCLKITQVLSCLEFDGLQLTGEYLSLIIKSLAHNKSLKYLSFKGCPILDEGCQEICEALHQIPNIEILNLCSCGLGVKSGEYIAKVIKYQQINRYCESWHSSLRYEDPAVNNMAGLKRLTLNNNPGLGDTGTELILQELIDDLWVRALDMQRCGITQRVAPRIFDVLQYSRSLRVADFRKNQLQPTTIAKVLDMLKDKNKADEEEDQDFQWCYTSTSLDTVSYGTYISSCSKLVAKPSRLYRTKSTIKPNTAINQSFRALHPVNSNQKIHKEKINNNLQKPDNTSLVKVKKQLMDLYEKLKDETKKREQAEEKCKKLQKQVDDLLTEHKNHLILKEFANMKQYISKFINFMKEHDDFEGRDPIIMDLQNALEEVHVLSKPFESPCMSPKQSIMFNTPRENSTVDVNPNPPVINNERDYTAADLKLQQMFQSYLGNSVPSLDSRLDLNLSVHNSDSSIDQRDYIPNSARSTTSSDSDSVETLKRLLEALDKDDEEPSWSTEYIDTASDRTSDRCSIAEREINVEQ